MNLWNRFFNKNESSDFDKYMSLKKELQSVQEESQELAKEYEINKSVLSIDLTDSNISDSDVKSRFNNFMDQHKKDVNSLLKRRSKIQKSMSMLENKELLSAVEEHETYFKVKKSYKEGKLSKSVFNNVLKAKQGKVKFADFLMFNENGEILILHRVSKEGDEGGEWCLPGGHVDLGEEYSIAAVRELKEETNLDPCPEREVTLVIKKETGDASIEYYSGALHPDQTITLDASEHDAYQWINPYTDLSKYEFIFDLKDVLKQYFMPYESDVLEIKENLAKAFVNGLITADALKKAVEALEEGQILGKESLNKKKPTNVTDKDNKPDEDKKKDEGTDIEDQPLSDTNLDDTVDKSKGGYELTVEVPNEESLNIIRKVVEHIKKIGNIGHSFTIDIDKGDSEFEASFGWDGDGGCFIKDIKSKETPIEKSNEEEFNKDSKDNSIEGGFADKKTVEQLAEKHGVAKEQIEQQISVGKGVELEHTDDEEKAVEIAMDHVWENANYYTDLAEMETKAEKRDEVEKSIKSFIEGGLMTKEELSKLIEEMK